MMVNGMSRRQRLALPEAAQSYLSPEPQAAGFFSGLPDAPQEAPAQSDRLEGAMIFISNYVLSNISRSLLYSNAAWKPKQVRTFLLLSHFFVTYCTNSSFTL